MRQAVFLASADLWQHGHGPAHPLKPERLQRTYELLEEYGAFQAANVQVVPRAWTLAFGVMSGQEFPHQLPPGYRNRYGGEWLHDWQLPPLDAHRRRQMVTAAQAAVERFKQVHL